MPLSIAEAAVRGGPKQNCLGINAAFPSVTFLLYLFFFNFFSTFIYFWDRERQSMNGRGAEREGDTESETGSRL